MEELLIPFLRTKAGTIEDAVIQLDAIPRNQMQHMMWGEPDIRPETSFVMAYDDDSFYLKYCVEEPYMKAVHKEINSPVYLDSCVEFFVCFGEDDGYYNLEFNSTGTCLGQFGPNKNDRVFLPAGVLKKITTRSHVIEKSEGRNLCSWELTVQIPLAVFIHHEASAIDQNRLRLNFYKCGDDLEEKHYLAWNKVYSPQPNFHLPAYFGVGKLEGKSISVQ